MRPEISARLILLNRQFYQTFAVQFSSTRQRLQPGVWKILDGIEKNENILDLGCGNGELAQVLAERKHQGTYVGLDFSDHLLTEASNNTPDSLTATFIKVDLSQPEWDSILPEMTFNTVLAFAALHHLPGNQLRCQVTEKIWALLHPGSRFFHSEWQFLNSPRLRKRIQPWITIGLKPGDVESGDYLLDWRHGGYGLRYVHHFSELELERLAEASGFTILDTFYSDGEQGNLGIYQCWGR